MNETCIALLTIILGEIFLFSLMILGTLIIYYYFAQSNELTIDIDSIEMNDESYL
jgi:hypothetical protein